LLSLGIVSHRPREVCLVPALFNAGTGLVLVTVQNLIQDCHPSPFTVSLTELITFKNAFGKWDYCHPGYLIEDNEWILELYK
jgi:hypothetical protein